MTDNLYLILHKVRGEPAFDVAMQVQIGAEDETKPGWLGEDWIIPTSGHRAYPYWTQELRTLPYAYANGLPTFEQLPCPPDLRDHYAASEPRSVPPVRRQAPATSTEDFIL